jgi:hypothetical protein
MDDACTFKAVSLGESFSHTGVSDIQNPNALLNFPFFGHL